MYVDYQNNLINLFNLDHSPFVTVTVPSLMINEGEYRVGYITWALFDCDTSMFEYVVQPAHWRNTFYIYRQDGTLLFKQDSTIGPWCVGCFALSYYQQPIYNTPAGAKLLLAKADSVGFYKTIDVYALCGTLPVNAQITDAVSTAHVKAFPNPTDLTINFEISPPNNIEKFELVVFDSNGREQNRKSVGPGDDKYSLDVNNLSSGAYFYSLFSRIQKLESGKFIISK